jgi:hypothetical protein
MSGAVSHKLITVSGLASNVTIRLVPARQLSANGECASGIRYSAGPRAVPASLPQCGLA